MKTIFTVLKKEMKSSFRDKRTLMTVLILPVVLFPLLFTAVFKIQTSIAEKNDAKKIKVALLNSSVLESFNVFDDPKFEVLTNFSLDEALKAINTEDLDVLVDFETHFEEKINTMQSANVSVIYRSSDDKVLSETSEKLDKLNTFFKEKRLTQLNINEELFTPIHVTSKNLSSKKEILVELAGGFLPYIFVIFLFMGCMYPAIDLTTGEKEKNTMETLLTAPVSRIHILLGKVLAMTLFGLMSALVAILGIFIFVQFAGELPTEISESIKSVLSLKFLLLLMGMLLPLSFFFASMLSGLAITAKSFKEAQSRVQPIMFTVFLPVMVALMPGVVLSWKTAIIPILNVSLTTKSIMLGAVNYYFYALTVVTLILIGLVAIMLSYKRFSNESIVLN